MKSNRQKGGQRTLSGMSSGRNGKVDFLTSVMGCEEKMLLMLFVAALDE